MKISISSSFDESILTSAADQLTSENWAALCIAASIMETTEQCVAVIASGDFGPALIEITESANLDTVVYLAVNADLGSAKSSYN